MSDRPLRVGKLPSALLRNLLPGPWPPELIVPPGIGEDACAIELGAGALIAAADPITLTGSDVGAHAVRVNANDVAVMGARPRWFLATVLLPVGTTEGEVRELFRSMRSALDELGATLVGGHTEVTRAVTQPLVAGQMLGQCAVDRCLRSSGVQPGDFVLQVGPAPIEGAALLSSEAGERIAAVPGALRKAAAAALVEPGICIVEAALLAAELGARAMHDPTEGGLSSGLHELAEASGLQLEVDAAAVLWFEPGVALCRAVGADPWGTLASGTLLAAFPAQRAEAARSVLCEAGHEARVIANARPGAGVVLRDGSPLVRHERDELSRVL